MKVAWLDIKYHDFDVVFIGCNSDHIKGWDPNSKEFEKNLFATYLFRGRISEFNKDSGQLVAEALGETCILTSVIREDVTYETFDDDTTWLCFSSYKPLTAEYLRLQGSLIIPKGIGVYCLLGSFSTGDQNAKALNYIRPRSSSFEINGDAKILLIKYGEFINIPKLHKNIK